MADEVEMIPVEPEAPPKADPFSKPTATKVSTIKLQPLARPPASPGAAKVPAPPIGERPPPAAGALKPGLKLPTQTAL
ncbi:MAG: hypothetical protein J6T01_05415, partial [Kiritimatiellae bacterium]|nr:hypothetical protein [Kiritimatiellia bacterium]